MADNIWTAAVEGIAARGRANNGAEGDYRDEEGFLCCGKCHTRKEGDITIGEKTLRVPHLCKCESEASRQREAEEKAAEFRKQCERLRKDGIADPSYLSQNFTQDDNRNARISDVCRRYVEHWPEMKADNMGRLVRDPELKYTPQGTAVTSFTLAVDRRFNRDKADYINIIAWRQTAEFVAKHFAKGQRVAIVGSIQTRSWEDNDGGKHKAVEIVADSVYFADAKKESAAGSYAESAMTSEGFEVTDENIPF